MYFKISIHLVFIFLKMPQNIHAVKVLIHLPLLFISFGLLLQYYPFIIIIFCLDINKKKIIKLPI